jgi:hypothetical protein
MSDFSYDELVALIGSRPGIHDVACPVCGPGRRDPKNRIRRVLRIWHREGFVSFLCKRCGISGWATFGNRPPSSERITDWKAAAAIAEREELARRITAARSLASRMKSAEGTIVETYLRDARNIHTPIPPTIGFLPASDKFPPAMIGLFGIPDEVEPGKLHLPLERVTAVHLTSLKPDGSGKDGVEPKRTKGQVKGNPLVLSPVNDSLGLLICEGIETGLSYVEALGVGVWAASSCTFMPALADVVPEYTDTVLIDFEGNREAVEPVSRLYDGLRRRGIHAEIVQACLLEMSA